MADEEKGRETSVGNAADADLEMKDILEMDVTKFNVAMAAEIFNDHEAAEDLEVIEKAEIAKAEGYIPQRGSRSLVVKVLGTQGNAKMDIAGPNDAYMDVFNPSTQDTARVPLMAKMEFSLGKKEATTFPIDILDPRNDDVSLTIICEDEEIGVAKLPSAAKRGFICPRADVWDPTKDDENVQSLKIVNFERKMVGSLLIKAHWEDEGAVRREIGKQYWRVCDKIGAMIQKHPWSKAMKGQFRDLRVGEMIETEERLTQPDGSVWVRLDNTTDNHQREGWVAVINPKTENRVLEKQSRKWTKARAALTLQNMLRRRQAIRVIKIHELNRGIWPQVWSDLVREKTLYTSATLKLHENSIPGIEDVGEVYLDFKRPRNDLHFRPHYNVVTLKDMLDQSTIVNTHVTDLLKRNGLMDGIDMMATLESFGITEELVGTDGLSHKIGAGKLYSIFEHLENNDSVPVTIQRLELDCAFIPGQRVECMHEGEWLGGEIERVRDDGVNFDVKFDMGAEDLGKHVEELRVPDRWQKAAQTIVEVALEGTYGPNAIAKNQYILQETTIVVGDTEEETLANRAEFEAKKDAAKAYLGEVADYAGKLCNAVSQLTNHEESLKTFLKKCSKKKGALDDIWKQVEGILLSHLYDPIPQELALALSTNPVKIGAPDTMTKARSEINTALADLAPKFPDHAGKHDSYRGFFLDEDFKWNVAQERFGTVTEKDLTEAKQAQKQQEQDFFASLTKKVTEIGENLGLMSPDEAKMTEDDKNELELLKEDLRGGEEGGEGYADQVHAAWLSRQREKYGNVLPTWIKECGLDKDYASVDAYGKDVRVSIHHGTHMLTTRLTVLKKHDELTTALRGTEDRIVAVTAAGGGPELDSLKKTKAAIEGKLAELGDVSKTQAAASKRRLDALKTDTTEGSSQSFERLEEQISDLENTPMSAADKSKAFRELQRNIDAASAAMTKAHFATITEHIREKFLSRRVATATLMEMAHKENHDLTLFDVFGAEAGKEAAEGLLDGFSVLYPCKHFAVWDVSSESYEEADKRLRTLAESPEGSDLLRAIPVQGFMGRTVLPMGAQFAAYNMTKWQAKIEDMGFNSIAEMAHRNSQDDICETLGFNTKSKRGTRSKFLAMCNNVTENFEQITNSLKRNFKLIEILKLFKVGHLEPTVVHAMVCTTPYELAHFPSGLIYDENREKADPPLEPLNLKAYELHGLSQAIREVKRMPWNRAMYLKYLDVRPHPSQAMTAATDTTRMITDHFARLAFLKWVWKFKFSKIFASAGLRNPAARIIQTFMRKMVCFLTYREDRLSIIAIQKWWRMVATGAKFAQETAAVVTVQKYWRKDMQFFRHQVNRRAAVICQAWFRGYYWRRYGSHNMHSYAFESDVSGRKVKRATKLREVRKPHIFEADLKQDFKCEVMDDSGVWQLGVVTAVLGPDGGAYTAPEANSLSTFVHEDKKFKVSMEGVTYGSSEVELTSQTAPKLIRHRTRYINLGDFKLQQEMAIKIQKMQRASSFVYVVKKIIGGIKLIQKVYRGYVCRAWFKEKMRSDIYPVMEAYQYKIGLWNRLARRINLVFRTSAKTIVIVGEVDEFGEALAKRFTADAFAVVILIDNLDVPTGSKIATKVTNTGKGQCYYQRHDLDDPAEIAQMARSIELQYQVVDILVMNSASKGAALRVDAPEMEHLENQGQMMNGPLTIFKHMFPLMNKGIVLNICPFEVQEEAPSMTASSVKAGLVALSSEVAGSHPDLRINCICPMVVMTDKPRLRRSIQEGIPDLCMYLTSTTAPFMSGQMFVAQGILTTKSYARLKRSRGEIIPTKYQVPEEELPEEVVVAAAPPKQRISLVNYEKEMLNQQSKFMSGFTGIAPTRSIGHNGKKLYAKKPAAILKEAPVDEKKKRLLSMKSLGGLSKTFGKKK